MTDTWQNHFGYVMSHVANTLGQSPNPPLQRHVVRFFESLAYLIPIEAKENYLKHMKKSPLYSHIQTAEKCIMWVNEAIATFPPSISPQNVEPLDETKIDANMEELSNTKSLVHDSPTSPSLESSNEPIVIKVTNKSDSLWRPIDSAVEQQQLESQGEALPQEQQFFLHASRHFIPTQSHGVAGTPASYRMGHNTRHSHALNRLKQSAGMYRGRTTT